MPTMGMANSATPALGAPYAARHTSMQICSTTFLPPVSLAGSNSHPTSTWTKVSARMKAYPVPPTVSTVSRMAHGTERSASTVSSHTCAEPS